MDVAGKVTVVTGGGSGIGRALAQRFAADGARAVVVVDKDADSASEVAASIGGLAIVADVRSAKTVAEVVEQTERAFAPIDLFVSNAGAVAPAGGVEISDEHWRSHWELHVMAHVWAARALLPGMLARGSGYLVSTASAAGLLMAPGAVPYTVTKHAALALAESLAVLYAGTGLRFSCVCPALVDTPLVASVADTAAGRAAQTTNEALTPAEAAQIIAEGIRDERFLILTHPDVADAVALRAASPADYLNAFSGLWSAVGGSSWTGEGIAS
jgi:NAD(P)-dependent dehydrogenase (short-subunit alcohol dehydrogenase family)